MDLNNTNEAILGFAPVDIEAVGVHDRHILEQLRKSGVSMVDVLNIVERPYLTPINMMVGHLAINMHKYHIHYMSVTDIFLGK